MILYLKVWGWLHRVWRWLKANWLWVFFPLTVLWLALRVQRRDSYLPDDPSAPTPEETQRQIKEEIDRKIEDLEKDKQEEVRRIVEAHDDAIEELTEEQQAEVSSLLSNPSALNDYLLDVGRKVRG